MKKIFCIVLLLAVGVSGWHQHQKAEKAGTPEKSWTNIFLDPGGKKAAAKKAEQEAMEKYKYHQQWNSMIQQIYRPLAHIAKNNKISVVETKDYKQDLEKMNTSLAKLADAKHKEEQKLGYLGIKFNKTLLVANNNRQTFQRELSTFLKTKHRIIQGSKVTAEERNMHHVNTANARWEDFKTSSKPTVDNQFQIVRKAESDANRVTRP